MRKALIAKEMERNGHLIGAVREFYFLNFFLIYTNHPEKTWCTTYKLGKASLSMSPTKKKKIFFSKPQ